MSREEALCFAGCLSDMLTLLAIIMDAMQQLTLDARELNIL